MFTYLTRVLRALAITCLGAGGGVGLLVFIVALMNNNNDPRSFQIAFGFGLGIGFVAATLLGVIFLLVDLSARLFLSKGNYEDIWKLEQSRELPADGTAKEIVAACRQALLAVPYVSAVTDDLENLLTRASVGQSWRSSGEEMEVEINPSGEHKWTLRCVSKPKAPDTIFDYGKNFENVEVWKTEVLQTLSGQRTHV